jgi:hypothetical protein
MPRDRPGPIRPEDRELAGELEMHHETQVAIEIDGEYLRASSRTGNRVTDHGGWIRDLRIAKQFRQPQIDRSHETPCQLALDDPACGFDFRQLGHEITRNRSI